METVNGGNLRKGMYIDFRGQPHQVTASQFVSPGKGSAFTRAKLRNLMTGNSLEFTFKSTENIGLADVNSRELQFSYIDGDDVWFMDTRSYEQFAVDRGILGNQVGFLVPEAMVYVVFLGEKPIGVNFPPKIKMKVALAEEAVTGDRATAGKRPVEMETGMIVQAPVFIKTGDTLLIDTEDGSYVSRAN